MQLVGYHGTKLESKESILENGFQLSSEKEWLGSGVYFFENLSPISDGAIEAESWVKLIRRFELWAVIETVIESDNCFDIFKNNEHRKKYFELREVLLRKHQAMKLKNEDFSDAVVFTLIAKELKVEVIRALVDGGRSPNYPSYVIKRPQLQLCVKELACIKKSRCVKEGIL
ncbi:MAG: hypothetical protein AB1403_16455 [Candidatus Riflebacteria bacterium]